MITCECCQGCGEHEWCERHHGSCCPCAELYECVTCWGAGHLEQGDRQERCEVVHRRDRRHWLSQGWAA